MALFVEFSGGVWFWQQLGIKYCKIQIKLTSEYMKENYISKRIIYMSANTWMPVRIMQIILRSTIHLS